MLFITSSATESLGRRSSAFRSFPLLASTNASPAGRHKHGWRAAGRLRPKLNKRLIMLRGSSRVVSHRHPEKERTRTTDPKGNPDSFKPKRVFLEEATQSLVMAK